MAGAARQRSLPCVCRPYVLRRSPALCHKRRVNSTCMFFEQSSAVCCRRARCCTFLALRHPSSLQCRMCCRRGSATRALTTSVSHPCRPPFAAAPPAATCNAFAGRQSKLHKFLAPAPSGSAPALQEPADDPSSGATPQLPQQSAAILGPASGSQTSPASQASGMAAPNRQATGAAGAAGKKQASLKAFFQLPPRFPMPQRQQQQQQTDQQSDQQQLQSAQRGAADAAASPDCAAAAAAAAAEAEEAAARAARAEQSKAAWAGIMQKNKPPLCQHGEPAALLKVNKTGPNKGERAAETANMGGAVQCRSRLGSNWGGWARWLPPLPPWGERHVHACLYTAVWWCCDVVAYFPCRAILLHLRTCWWVGGWGPLWGVGGSADLLRKAREGVFSSSLRSSALQVVGGWCGGVCVCVGGGGGGGAGGRGRGGGACASQPGPSAKPYNEHTPTHTKKTQKHLRSCRGPSPRGQVQAVQVRFILGQIKKQIRAGGS